MQGKKTILVIPAFNEKDFIGKTVDTALEWVREKPHERELVVVDDGSKDNTAREAKLHGAQVIRSGRTGGNRGKADAFLAGVRHAHRKGAKFLLTVDADSVLLLRNHLDQMEDSIRKRSENMLTFKAEEKRQVFTLDEKFSGVRAYKMGVFTPLLKGAKKWDLLRNARFGQEEALNYLIPSRVLLDFSGGKRILQREAHRASNLVRNKQSAEIEKTIGRVSQRKKLGRELAELHHFRPKRARLLSRHFKKWGNLHESLVFARRLGVGIGLVEGDRWREERRSRIRKR